MSLSFSEYEQKLFHGILQNSISGLAEAAYLYFDQPITLIDGFYRLIEHFPKEIIGEKMFDSLVTNRRVTQEMIDVIAVNDAYTFTAKQSKSYYFNYPDIGAPRIGGAVIFDGRRIGTYGIICPKEPSKDMLDAADLFAQAVSVVMEKKNLYTGGNDLLENVFMHDLISGVVQNEQDIVQWSKYCPGIVKGDYQIITAKTDKSVPQIALESACTKLRGSFQDVCACVEGDVLYVLLCNISHENKTDRMVGFLREKGLYCGISRTYCRLTDTQLACFMAHEALKYGKSQHPDQRVFLFEDIVIKGLTDKLCSFSNCEAYYHTVFEKLCDYDEKNNGELFNTLVEYIRCFKDLGKASQRLNIHRNTLKYRLERIAEVTDIDLSDDDTSTWLFLNCCMMKQ